MSSATKKKSFAAFAFGFIEKFERLTFCIFVQWISFRYLTLKTWHLVEESEDKSYKTFLQSSNFIMLEQILTNNLNSNLS
jgi:hypothetical protein